MKNRLYLLILSGFLLSSISYCFANTDVSNDSLIVVGKIRDGQNGQFLTTGLIDVNGNEFYIDKSGDFNIKILEESAFQITFRSIGYRPLLIKYSPNGSHKIDLEEVLMFKDTMTLINYTCRSWQFLCKYHRNRYSKGLDKHTRKERIKNNAIVEKYNYSFKGNDYPFLCDKKNDLIIVELY